jgi:hypothetical protein
MPRPSHYVKWIVVSNLLRKDWNCCSLRTIHISCSCRPVGAGYTFRPQNGWVEHLITNLYLTPRLKMPAWCEYGVVDLYLSLDCTMWAKPTCSANGVCCYWLYLSRTWHSEVHKQLCCRYCAIISGTVVYGLPWVIARSITRQPVSDPHMLRLLFILTLCQRVCRRETNSLKCEIYFPNANMPVFFSAFVPHLGTQSLESNKFESECKYFKLCL